MKMFYEKDTDVNLIKNKKLFNEKKEALKFSLIIQRQNLIWSNWLQALRDNSDIEDNRFDFY